MEVMNTACPRLWESPSVSGNNMEGFGSRGATIRPGHRVKCAFA